MGGQRKFAAHRINDRDAQKASLVQSRFPLVGYTLLRSIREPDVCPLAQQIRTREGADDGSTPNPATLRVKHDTVSWLQSRWKRQKQSSGHETAHGISRRQHKIGVTGPERAFCTGEMQKHSLLKPELFGTALCNRLSKIPPHMMQSNFRHACENRADSCEFRESRIKMKGSYRMLESDPIARDLIAKALGRAVDQAVKDHLSGISQEAQITSRIGQILESTLSGKEVLDHRIEVFTQDIPDRGPGSLEKAIGADLYVGISVSTGGQRKTKGFLVQAKIDRKLKSSSDFAALDKDCRDMLQRSDASYLWLYESNGVRVVDAKNVVKRGSRSPKELQRRRASTVFSRTLECSEGDFSLGLPSVRGTRKKPREALGEMLEELRIRNGIGIKIT